MAKRFVVVRRWVKHKGVMYEKGDYLPEDFTHHDKFRTVYPSRIGVIDLPDAPLEVKSPAALIKNVEESKQLSVEAPIKVEKVEAEVKPEVKVEKQTPAASTKPTKQTKTAGTGSLSGKVSEATTRPGTRKTSLPRTGTAT